VNLDSGDTAWLLVSCALVLLMAPGLAIFYGGMVRSRSVLNMIMMSMASLAVVSVVWVLVGYSIAFGDDIGGGLLGDPTQYAGLASLMDPESSGDSTVPRILFAAFQGLFGVITAALISGAIADRARFGAWVVFVAVWTVLVYAPIAHWVFDFSAGDHEGGWAANRLGLVDYAGGTAVEICSGASALALALVLGRRVGFGRDPMKPHNLTLVMTGAGLLWFGWFGFNAGSALAARSSSPPGWRAAAACSAGWRSSASGTATPPRWARLRAWWPVWSRSRPRAGR
jgi:Amt family ammonium transporter